VLWKQHGIHLEKLCHENPVKVVEKLVNECCYMNLKKLLRQNNKTSTDLTLQNEMVVGLGTMSHQEDYIARCDLSKS